jgi:predicted RNase H-like HicB family nuclease
MSNRRRLTQFSLPVAIFKEGKYFIAHTPLLNLSIQGQTEEEARKRFTDAVVLFFEELEDMGTTDEVLFELGWKKFEKEWRPPAVSLVTQPVEVPVPIAA